MLLTGSRCDGADRADKKAMNSFNEMAVMPQENKMQIGQTFEYTAPANSLTVIHLLGLSD